MPSRDTRHVVIKAPPDGGTTAPPPRRRAAVVDPPSDELRTQRPAPTGWWERQRQRPIRLAVVGLALVAVLSVLLGLVFGVSQFNRVERVELGDVLASGNGTNYLIVGSDTREGIDPNDPDAGAILGPEAPVGSERSDTILILRVDGDGARMLSVPRDLLVTIAETGAQTRINAAFNGGPRRLVATLTAELGLPVHHYLEIDFVSFRDLVDALGGIEIEFPHPASDPKSGLDVREAGTVRLSGAQALAFVRSRTYTETIDGRQVVDPTGDVGRVQRQQQFLAAVVAEIGGIRNPFRLASVTSAVVDGLRIDERLGFTDALSLLARFRGLDPAPNSLPTTNRTLGNGAQVLVLVQPDADAVLASFGSDGAR